MPETKETRKHRRILRWLIGQLAGRDEGWARDLADEADLRMGRPYKRRRHDPSKEEVGQALREHTRLRDAAAVMGIGPDRLRRLMDAYGFERHKHTRVTEDERADMIRLYKGGMSTTGIAEICDRPPSTVWRVLRSAGVTLRSRGPYALDGSHGSQSRKSRRAG